ncbi:hypothetical protein M514_11489 [Trichuris suis]|uniref:Uncharacterized protein n=1 Tax=Trichuris suis TaxID=68888 RepID=A0A085LRN0_9BILA|nr:hypothetical protein M513_11489 [Trichuris suis]KFD72319.1 hypothetical protein M514_11489 [Trichuris suis]KHJ49302.1 hypothetical protein D918_00427 [Trichuris suis]
MQQFQRPSNGVDNSANFCPFPPASGYNEAWKQYCDNFNAMKAWFRHHFAFSDSETTSEAPAQPHQNLPPVPCCRQKCSMYKRNLCYKIPFSYSRKRRRRQWNRVRKARYRLNRQRRKRTVALNSKKTEIDSEFLSFLMVSQLHRQDREAKKTEVQKDEVKQTWLMCSAGQYTDIEKVSIYYRPSTAEDLLAPIADRRSIAKMMYGAAGDRIYDLEEEMQAKFDAEIDTHNPPLWPATPLRL